MRNLCTAQEGFADFGKHSMFRLIYCTMLICALIFSPKGASADERVAWRRLTLDVENINESVAIIDVDRDGRLDVFAGRFWYQAPTWKRRFVRDVEVIRGRKDDYSSLPLDVNGDGWPDLVSVNYRSRSIYWVEHPGKELGKRDKSWTRHVIATPGASETGRIFDIDHDGRPDVLPNGTDFAAWFSVSHGNERDAGAPSWSQHRLPEQLAGHGIGFGDVNGDGRGDVVGTSGWAEAKGDSRWVWHSDFRLHADAGIPILVHDVDGDGDSDLVWGRGHNIGLYWLEQLANEEQVLPESAPLKWRLHAIDTTWSQAHTLLLDDVDGDGRLEVIAGKRYLGHDGKDPGEYNPLVIAWYKFNREARTWSQQVISESSDVGFGLDAKSGDIDGDGDVDIVCAGRSGLYLLENLRKNGIAAFDEPPLGIAPQSYERPADLTVVIDTDGGARPVKTAFDWGMRRAHVLANMQRVMGPLPSSTRRVQLNVRVLKSENLDKYRRHTIRYESEPGSSVPALLLVPHQIHSPAPAMLCLHPTSPLGKAQVAGIDGRPTRFYAHELAEQGYVCLAPDYPSFGDYHDYDFAADAHESGTMKAIWDNIRGIDLLESLDFVDGDRIGAIGHSLGGHNTLFTAAFDERIRLVVTSCGFGTFHDYHGGNLQGWAKPCYMPRIASVFNNSPDKMPFDFPEVVGAIAPRPIFISAPLRDDNFNVAGVKKCVASASTVYRLYGEESKLQAIHPDVDHDFPKEVSEQVYTWLERAIGR